ncbi:helix-turn-helix transcriptional regulator [Propylenella binzhouense]|uniref:AlpA family phage regulatory protein n=1 Tax=Propylenella binzhouense TaxID=2555902 RepID=A0A964T332_9HYPH|nr:AlpA family phage regulatory protein [Propylenella binzhouense]MYZ47335.1 AlpA family phage regulatory protein [Propylenella binzhouense]
MELLSIRRVMDRLNVGRTSLWKLSKDDPTFPKPVQVTPGRKAFVANEINAWIAARIAERDQAGRA